MGPGNRLTPEFRREAVRLALSSGRTRREIANDLGIGLSGADPLGEPGSRRRRTS